jgi:hypothetical protein
LKYHLNGIWVFFTVVAVWWWLGYKHIISWDWLYTHRWQSLTGAIIFGLLFSIAIVLPNKPVKKIFSGRSLFWQVTKCTTMERQDRCQDVVVFGGSCNA